MKSKGMLSRTKNSVLTSAYEEENHETSDNEEIDKKPNI
jgi:hypothetical protein